MEGVVIGTLVVLSLLSGVEPPERVLFVGNSYTFYGHSTIGRSTRTRVA